MSLIKFLFCATVGLVTVSASPPLPTCSNGSTYEADFGGCISFHADATPMVQAESACQAEHGHLMSIHNAFENAILSSILFNNHQNAQVWIGLFRDNSGNWAWSDGSALDYLKWASGEPNNNGAVIDPSTGGSWKSVDKTSNHTYFCLHPAMQPTQPPLPSWTSCPPGWSFLAETNACYITGANATYATAASTCNVLGARLASIHSAHENYFVAGLQVTSGYNVGMWLGAAWDDSQSTWSWEDGTPMDYKNAPNQQSSDAYSLAVNVATQNFGSWTANSKSTTMDYFVCKHTLE